MSDYSKQVTDSVVTRAYATSIFEVEEVMKLEKVEPRPVPVEDFGLFEYKKARVAPDYQENELS